MLRTVEPPEKGRFRSKYKEGRGQHPSRDGRRMRPLTCDLTPKGLASEVLPLHIDSIDIGASWLPGTKIGLHNAEQYRTSRAATQMVCRVLLPSVHRGHMDGCSNGELHQLFESIAHWGTSRRFRWSCDSLIARRLPAHLRRGARSLSPAAPAEELGTRYHAGHRVAVCSQRRGEPPLVACNVVSVRVA